jgi:hypothetical protein
LSKPSDDGSIGGGRGGDSGSKRNSRCGVDGNVWVCDRLLWSRYREVLSYGFNWVSVLPRREDLGMEYAIWWIAPSGQVGSLRPTELGGHV